MQSPTVEVLWPPFCAVGSPTTVDIVCYCQQDIPRAESVKPVHLFMLDGRRCVYDQLLWLDLGRNTTSRLALPPLRAGVYEFVFALAGGNQFLLDCAACFLVMEEGPAKEAERLFERMFEQLYGAKEEHQHEDMYLGVGWTLIPSTYREQLQHVWKCYFGEFARDLYILTQKTPLHERGAAVQEAEAQLLPYLGAMESNGGVGVPLQDTVDALLIHVIAFLVMNNLPYIQQFFLHQYCFGDEPRGLGAANAGPQQLMAEARGNPLVQYARQAKQLFMAPMAQLGAYPILCAIISALMSLFLVLDAVVNLR